MSQRYKTLILSKYNLGLLTKANFNDAGLAKYICNVNCQNGKICSAQQQKDIFEIIEPTRAEAVIEAFKSTVGNCLWLTGYSTLLENGEEVSYIVFCNSDYKIYYYKLGAANPSFIYLNNITFTSKPIFEFFIKDNKNHFILCSKTDDMWVWDGENEPYQVLDAPCVNNMAVAFSRLFVTTPQTPYSVLFSSDLDPSNWTMSAGDAGEVKFNDSLGKVLSVFAIDNYIYVMRERGIVKLYNYNSNNNSFAVSQVYLSTSKIYDNSIAVSGDKILFVCNDGIYSFDGLNGKKLYGQLNDIIHMSEDMCGLCLNNKYYLCANIYNKASYNNALVIVDLQQEDITQIIMGNKYYALCALSAKSISEVVVLSKNMLEEYNVPIYIGKALKNYDNAEFIYKSKVIRLEPEEKRKTLVSIKLKSLNNATLTVNSETSSKKISIIGSPYYQKIKLGLLAHEFSFELSGIGDVSIDGFTIDYSYVE